MYNIIKYYYQGAIQGPRRPLLEMCSDPKDVSLYLCEITVESQNFRSEHNFKAHIIFTKEHLGSVIWWLAQSHTAGQREEFSVQVWLPAPKPECPTRYYFCAWLTSSPIRPCKLPHKSSGWNTPCLTIKRPTFVVICLHLQIPVLKIERLIIRDCGLRDRFPWGYHVWRILKSSDFGLYLTKNTSQKFTQKRFRDISFLVSHSERMRVGPITIHLCHGSVSFGYLRRYRSHHLGSWDILWPPHWVIKQFRKQYICWGGKLSFETPCNSFWTP